MGIFSGLKDTYKKSEGAVLVQKLLEQQVAAGLLSLDPASLANKLVNVEWNRKPDIYSGKFGQRPHKISLAAMALAHGIQIQPPEFKNPSLLIALGNLLSELEVNGNFYPLNSLDHELIKTAANIFLASKEALDARIGAILPPGLD